MSNFKKNIVTAEDFASAAKEILAHPKVQQMKQYIQHGSVTCYEHSVMVAVYSYAYAKKLRLKVSIEALVKGALLHDFFLYDWHNHAFTHDGLHGFSHPVTAERNANNTFKLSLKERKIIKCHMWPLTLTRIPTSKEGWLVCAADKYCSLKETFLKNPYGTRSKN